MRENLTKKKLLDGQTVFGCFLRNADADLAELLSLQGYDCLVFDGEHGPIEPRDCLAMARAAELHDVTTIIRPPLQPTIPRFLDTGAQGILVPMVNSREDAQLAVNLTKYAPQGQRGLANARAADFGCGLSLPEYTKFANEQTLVVAQIETVAAVDALDQIAQVDGVDVLFVGPTDLSQSLGVTGQLNHPRMTKTMDRIIEVVASTKKTLGIMVGDEKTADHWQQRGARFLTVTVEAMLVRGCRQYLDAVR